MQLFITTYSKKNNVVTIDNADLLTQVRKVLRGKIGDTLWIQNPLYEAKKQRYKIRIDDWDDSFIQGTIISEISHELPPKTITMIIAMPNKRDKAEMIVQKLSEIGVTHIIFRPTERSVIKQRNKKKAERLQKISKEAVEQSRGRRVLEIIFTTNIHEHITHTELIIFDKEIGNREQKTNICDLKLGAGNHIVGIIGPEGGLTANDYQEFEQYKHRIIGLGTTILRMETAAIIGGRLLKNNE